LLCGLLETDGGVKLGFNGDLYTSATEVITTQGDLRRGDSSGNPERLGIGSSGKVLQSNGTTESWETLTTADSVLTTQGDVLYEGASGLARLGQSTDGFVLTTKGSSANPVWASAGGATAEIDNATITSDFSTTSSSFIDVTSLVITIGNILNGKTMITAILTIKRSTDGSISAILEDDGSELATTFIAVESTHTKEYNMCTSYAMDSDASVVQVQVKTGGGTLVVEGDASNATSQIVSMSVG